MMLRATADAGEAANVFGFFPARCVAKQAAAAAEPVMRSVPRLPRERRKAIAIARVPGAKKLSRAVRASLIGASFGVAL